MTEALHRQAPPRAGDPATLDELALPQALPPGLAREAVLDDAGIGPGANAVTTVRLSGRADRAAFDAAVAATARRHRVLRTGVRMERGVPVGLVRPAGAVPVAHTDLRSESEPAMVATAVTARAAAARLPLTLGPAVSWSVLRLADTQYELVLVQRAAVADCWPVASLLEQLDRHGLRAGEDRPMSARDAAALAGSVQWVLGGHVAVHRASARAVRLGSGWALAADVAPVFPGRPLAATTLREFLGTRLGEPVRPAVTVRPELAAHGS